MDNKLIQVLGFDSFGKPPKKRKTVNKKCRYNSIQHTYSPFRQISPLFIDPNNQEKVSFLQFDHSVGLRRSNFLFDKFISVCQLSMPSNSNDEKPPDDSIVYNLIMKKKRFSNLNRKLFLEARAAINPYECLGNGMFLNRSAMKMVNLDALFGFTSSINRNEDFYFADICGGPGGFSEYLCWRCKELGITVKGFGISLRDACEWKLGKTNEHVKLIFGVDGTGNIYNIKNIDQFASEINIDTKGQGAQLVLADGGFNEARDKVNQECLMHRLILSEVISMLKVIRKRGHFVLKTFELTTDFSKSLVYVLYVMFRKLTIIKPVSTRPASSERYVVCLDFQGDNCGDVVDYMESINELMDNTIGITSFVDPGALFEDDKFSDYLSGRTEELANAQIEACEAILEYCSGSYRRAAKANILEYIKNWNLDSLYFE